MNDRRESSYNVYITSVVEQASEDSQTEGLRGNQGKGFLDTDDRSVNRIKPTTLTDSRSQARVHDIIAGVIASSASARPSGNASHGVDVFTRLC